MLDITKLDTIFTELGKVATPGNELTICGGASMVLNYGTRQSTRDVDCLSLELRLKNQAEVMADDLGLDCDWLNDNVSVTLSYSERLANYSEIYKKYGNLTVYTIKGLPLLCMKLVAWRPNSSDYDDCLSILHSIQNHVTLADVMKMIEHLYGSTSVISLDAQKVLNYEFDKDVYALDSESLESLRYSLDKGLVKFDELPKEFQSQLGEDIWSST